MVRISAGQKWWVTAKHEKKTIIELHLAIQKKKQKKKQKKILYHLMITDYDVA